jgi:hypothetical protein
VLPSVRLGVSDAGIAVDFDNACCLALIMTAQGGDEDDDEWEDVPVGRPDGGSPPARRTETHYY